MPGHYHDAESAKGYFVEQLLSILVCGAFGFVAIRLQQTGMLDKILAPQFHLWVYVGGIGVLVLVALRAVAIWKEAGELQNLSAQDANGPTCGVNHPHGPDCNHDLGIGGEDDHGHSHDLSWAFARMGILFFPVALFLLGLPNASYSNDEVGRRLGKDASIGAAELKELASDAELTKEEKQPNGDVVRTLKSKSGLLILATTPANGGEPTYKLPQSVGGGIEMKFNELNEIAFDEGKRNAQQGNNVTVEGRFKRVGDKEFTLFRLKMTCCAADTVPLKVRIIVPEALGASDYKDFDWVRVTGQLQFLKVPDQERYIPVIRVASLRAPDMKKVEPTNQYEQ